jgi:hypothetical protein
MAWPPPVSPRAAEPPWSGRGADLALLALLALSLRAAVAVLIPHGHFQGDANCAPDEVAHVTVARDLAHGRAPTWPASESIYSAFPPTPYAVHAITGAAAAPLAALEPRLSRPPRQEHAGYLPYRLGGVLLGVAGVLLFALAAAAWWPRDRIALWMTGGIAAAYPQHLFVSGYVNADAYVFASQGLLLAALARWVRRGEGDVGLRVVAIACAAVVIGKTSAWGVLPATGLWVLWAAWRRRAGSVALARAVALGLALVVPVLGWNAWRTGGDALGVSTWLRFMQTVWTSKPLPMVEDGWRLFATQLCGSAFARFGNMGVRIASGYYSIALVLAAAGAVALCATALRAREHPQRRAAAWVLGAIACGVGLAAWTCYRHDFQPQGRYVLFQAVLLAVAGATPLLALRGRLRGLALLPAAFYLIAALQSLSVLARRPC